MTEIDREVLEYLRCDYCLEYLSCTPVLLKKSGKSICGRCTVSRKDKSTYVRNEAYERLASVILFPCRYHSNGCEEMLQMNEMKAHEVTCRYTRHRCPTFALDKKCDWTGSLVEIEHHYKEHHPDLFIPHPYRVKPIIIKDSINNFLLKMSGFLFLLQIKVETSNGQFWHCVRLLDHPKLCYMFQYTIKIANDIANISSLSIVEPYKDFKVIKQDCIKHKIKNILSEMENYEDIHYELKVTMLHVICDICKIILTSAPVYPISNGFCCEKCYEYQDASLKLKNHQIIKRKKSTIIHQKDTTNEIQKLSDNGDDIKNNIDKNGRRKSISIPKEAEKITENKQKVTNSERKKSIVNKKEVCNVAENKQKPVKDIERKKSVISQKETEELTDNVAKCNKNNVEKLDHKNSIVNQKETPEPEEKNESIQNGNVCNNINKNEKDNHNTEMEKTMLIQKEEIEKLLSENTVEKYINIFENNMIMNEETYEDESEEEEEEIVFKDDKKQIDIFEAQHEENIGKLTIKVNSVGKWWYGKFRAFNILFNLDFLLSKDKICLDISTNRYNEKKCFDNTTYSCNYNISLPNSENVFEGEFSGNFKNWHFEKIIPEEYLNIHGCPDFCIIYVDVIKE